MSRLLALAAAALAVGFTFVDLAEAEYVHGYTRQDGTYVHGYTRSTGHAKASHGVWRELEDLLTSAAPGAWHPIERDRRGRIRRSPEARAEFKREHPCPATGLPRGACPGYVIDHVIPLEIGGADNPSNMQWQTTAAAKAKDKVECGGHSCSVH